MKKVFLLCIAALCFCAAGLFAACNGPEPPADTGGESQIEQPNGEQPQEGHAGSENTEESEQPQGGNEQDEEQKEEPGDGGAISDQGGETDGKTDPEGEAGENPGKEEEDCTHAVHRWGAWQTVFDAECGKNGLKICHCTACGASKAEIIPALNHTAQEQFYDQSMHWRVCERCGEIFGKEEHSFGGDACACGFVCDFTRGLEYEKIAGKEEYRVTGEGSFSGNEIIVPATYKGLPVTEVGEFAFSDLNAQKIVLPESVQRVGYQAFSYCAAEEIVLPQTMQSIGDAAFYFCSNLQKINLPEGIERVGDSAFYFCSSLREIVIPDSVIEIGYQAFDYCSCLTRITIGKNTESISGNFLQCNRLFEVYNRSVLPIEADGTYKFGGVAKNAKNIYTIGSGFSKMGTTKNGVRYFADADKVYLLDYYGTETEVALPETIGGKPCILPQYAFNGAESVRKLTIPGSIKNIPYACFSGMPNLTELVLEEGVESIGGSCFLGAGLTEVKLPASLTSLAGRTFGANITKISVAEGNPVYKSAGNCVIETASKTLVWGCAASDIPADGSVTKIGSSAFSGCSKLKEITIPAAVKEIGGSAFYFSGLEKVTLSEGLETIGMHAFSYCENLKEINIPSTVKTIYTSAFYGTLFEKVYFAAADGWQIRQDPDQPWTEDIAEEMLSDPAAAAEAVRCYGEMFYFDKQRAAWVRSV